ncbi:MAG: TetR-like C-terminal domain-containing protein [Hyphomicrobiaceae bacterium]
MPQPTYRDGLRTTTRNIAHTILSTSGLSALQARKVAAAADCSVGTLYNVWRNLDELIIAANAITLAHLGSVLTTARDATPAGASVEQRLLALADAYVIFAIDKRNAWRALFDHRLPRGKTAPDWYRAAQSELFAIVETALVSVVADPAERSRAARAFFASVHGIVSIALDEKLGDFDRQDCEAQVRFIVTAAARGLPRADGAISQG